jgi:hypothetical protein
MTKKYYLSRAQTRAMSGYEPIGDAFGGAAYGEKNDPVSAGFAIYSMYGAYAATAITVWQGVAAVGGALTLIGMATGNSKLTKLGQLGMVAGGIGNFAESAMADPSALSEAGATTAPASPDGLGPVSDAVATPVVDGQLVTSAPPPAPVDVGPATNLNTGPTVNPVDVNQVGGPTTSLNNPLSPPPVPEGSVPVVDRGLASTPQVGPPSTGPSPNAVKPGTPGLMDKIAGNPMAMYAAASTVSTVGDYLSGKTDAEIDAMKAQTGYNNAKALETQAMLDKEKLRRANLNAGYTNVDTSMKVNPNALIARPWDSKQAAAPAAPAGLIAGARTA